MVKLPRNFRSVIDGHVYRCANPDSTEPEELERWINYLNITTIIDLRSKSEIRTTSAEKDHVRKFYPLQSPEEFLDQNHNSPARIAINLDRTELYKAVFQSDNLIGKIIAFFLMLWLVITGDRTPLMRYAAKYILGKSGPNRMFSICLDSTPNAMKDIFQIIIKAGRKAVLISCKLGKDRTGMVCALVQDLMGVPRDRIIADFEKSQDELSDIQASITKWFNDRNFPDSYAYSDGKEIDLTVQHIHATYGSSEGYLKFIGLSVEEIEQLKSTLRV